MKILVWGVCIVLAAALTACSARPPPAPTLISSIRPQLPNTKVIEFRLPRQEYFAALGRDELNRKVRIIEIFQSAREATAGIPEYRFFNVVPKSVYGVLGLRSADVLVGAHGYIVQSAKAFYRYLFAMQSEQRSEIEVRRDGQPILLKFEFVE